jgi:integrase
MVEGKVVSHIDQESLGSGLKPSGEREGKSRPQQLPNQPCPQCGSKGPFYKDGLRYVHNGPVQRFLCRCCGFRFSERLPEPNQEVKVFGKVRALKPGSDLAESSVCNQDFSAEKLLDNDSLAFGKNIGSHTVTNTGKGLNALRSYLSNAECAPKKAKNLSAATETKTVAGEKESLPQNINGLVLEYAWKMKKRGQAETTIKDRIFRLNGLVKKGADLMNPDSVETVLATENWTPANKKFYVMAYLSFAKTFNIAWEPIKVSCAQKEIFIPLEKELNALISGSGKKTAAFLQMLKTTGARCGEARKLKWTDINVEANTISINAPEKGSRSRTIKVPVETIAMLNSLPKRGPYVFSPPGNMDPPKARSLQGVFSATRDKLARNLQNQRLKQIHFHTFRHWFGTMLYAKTKDILYVKQQLGHKRIENTELYTHLVSFGSEEYHTAFAKTLNEEDKLIQEGFEFVRFSEKDQVAIYRKRK